MGVQVSINRTTAARAAALLMAKDLKPIAERALANAKANVPNKNGDGTGTVAANLELEGPFIHGTEVVVQIGVFHSGRHIPRWDGERKRPTIAQVLVYIEEGIPAYSGKRMIWRSPKNNGGKLIIRRSRDGVDENDFLINATRRLMTRYRGGVREYI